jgi:hypothetical protein
MIEPRAIAIIASREDVTTLKNCIGAAIRACKGQAAVIDVLVNGNPLLAETVAKVNFGSLQDCNVRVWNITQGDKAHAWNEYVHRIWPQHGNAVFIDGYVEISENSLDALENALATSAQAWAATGVPTSGRSAARAREEMLREGGFQGNLHALRAHAMHALRARGIRLPLGLYRADSLIGALLILGLEPAVNRWDRQRIVVEPDAVWKVRELERITWRSAVSQWKRMLRQAQGDLENRAAREHLSIRRLAPELLPATARELVNTWIAEQGAQARRLVLQRPLCAYAAWRLRPARDWSAAAIAPVLVTEIGNIGNRQGNNPHQAASTTA